MCHASWNYYVVIICICIIMTCCYCSEHKLFTTYRLLRTIVYLIREAERIRRRRGLFALRDEPEVARVWLPNIDSPGLAMARALGDFCLKNFGLISVPEISYRCITEKDEFIVLATDGVWDVLSNRDGKDCRYCFCKVLRSSYSC
ncbi:unnamed protein product [Musa acuminata subsp. malaccensis]|uniref:protein-serine/threonine phosphatase n=1 Tax=Musa acuminata subsp. malaccensis TaxID=214687 RepID=A0A804JHQ3_MUSAM|nr:unnamed protein product [Musa acuminata subsp. malaccensis]